MELLQLFGLNNMRFALINNEIVVNIIIADEQIGHLFENSYDYVIRVDNIQQAVKMGDLFINNEFIIL